MDRIINFLSELDEFELAYFAKFRLSTYMKGTQLKVNEYLKNKNLTENRIEQLISENPKSKLLDNKKRCPRCYSDKILKENVEWTDTSNHCGYSDEIAVLDGLSGKATYKEQIICNVCGYWITDPNNEKRKSIWKSFWNFITD